VAKSRDYEQHILNLFDGYVHGSLSRRQFIDKAAADLAWQRTVEHVTEHL
jgi:hypothetical protein